MQPYLRPNRFRGGSFEVAVLCDDVLRFDPHCHDEYVISANLIGHERLRLDRHELSAPEGATTLYNPGQTQGGEGTQKIVSLYLEPDYYEQNFGFQKVTEFSDPIVESSALLAKMAALTRAVENDPEAGDIEERVLDVVDFCSAYFAATVMKQDSVPCSWRVRQLQDMLCDDLSSTPPMSELAEAVGLTKPGMVRMFKQKVGIPPATWQRTQRLREARRLLRMGKTAVEVAYETGFSDQAHMCRIFRRAYGLPPSCFARG